MRNLTIKREKSFVGCLMKLKVYIEDPEANELTINQVPCRKLGDLKNGEEKTFRIGEQEARVFVIADKLSKDYCNEFYTLEAGCEDVALTGKNSFNPAGGNPFRFANNESTQVTQNRKRGTRIGLLVLIVAGVLGAVAGAFIGKGIVGSPKVEEKTFSYDTMQITLTNEFKEASVDGYTVAFDSEKIAILMLKEPFALAPGFGDQTLEEYGDLVLKNNGLSGNELKAGEGFVSFQYDFTNPNNKTTFRYYTYLYKAGDAFWLVQFATAVENAQKYEQQISQWAKTIEFAN